MSTVNLRVFESKLEGIKSDSPLRHIRVGCDSVADFMFKKTLSQEEMELILRTAVMKYCEELTNGRHSLFRNEIIEDEAPLRVPFLNEEKQAVFHYVIDTQWSKGIKRLGKYKFSVIIDKEDAESFSLKITKGKETVYVNYDVIFFVKKQPVNNWANIDRERAAKEIDMDAFNAESKIILANIR